ncbi:MAG: glucans biosynthesis glucosyltransferase MdoH, partial [Gammaproteobacteria bacterium]
ESNIRSLAQTGQEQAFDFYLLSDTQDPSLIKAEAVAWRDLQQRLGPLAQRVYYRRRIENRGRKVGNITDFCEQWGARYDFLIVLDADSLMTGDCVVELALRMQDNPQAGLIQTTPMPVCQDTLFGRFIQFAAQLYSPLLSSGYAFWQSDNCNYWGHNAIIRLSAFMSSCGLPSLPGRAPFGGDILSHDFVEAALLYRAGWDVYLVSDLTGSYEEVPGNIIDFVKRDRRWVQGNLQHLALLGGTGFSWISRIHFLFGALAYISSLSWMCMLVFSTLDAVLRAISSDVFFSQAHQLFPSWPMIKTGTITSLLYLTMIVLFAPKVMGCVTTLIHHRRSFGGALALLVSALIELAVLVAPLMMCFHAFFVLCVLLGFDVKWDAQPREGRIVGWREAWQRCYPLTLIAVIWTALTAHFSALFLYWLSPVLLGMLLAPVLIRYTISKFFGVMARRLRCLVVPTELGHIPILQSIDSTMKAIKATPLSLEETVEGSAATPLPPVPIPPIQYQAMPKQPLKLPRRDRVRRRLPSMQQGVLAEVPGHVVSSES